MKFHTKIYLDYFGLGLQDIIFCEYSYIKYGAMIRAGSTHHIIYRSHGGTDDIINLIALSSDVHNKAHQEQISKSEFQDIHIEFTNNNPY